MSKFFSSIIAIALLVTLAPLSLAHSTTSDEAVRFASAEVRTDRQRVVGEVELCNKEYERVRFILNVKNETINSLYRRRLSLDGGKCKTVELDFNKNFAEMSKAGDVISFHAKSVRGLLSYGRYALSDPYTTVVKEGNVDDPECGDASGGDEIYTVCEGDFITHEPTGLRIKVISEDSRRARVYVTHVRWGGVKRFWVYKNRSKEVVAGDEDHTKVEMSNLLGENKYDFLFKLESH